MKRVLFGLGLMGLSAVIMVDHVNAQVVVSDGTLNTIVTQSGNTFTIDNGTPSGSNLFHSFREFSIPTGGSAIFNNATNIQNIFSRVTGGTASNIDGVIQAQGSANLFLLNPAGILFGANASLNIGGSFVGTTANSIKFADGMEFSATNPNDRPLLTMSAPIGLQMGSNPGAIQVNGIGHALAYGLGAEATGRLLNVATNDGLQVINGQTLALVGGNLNLTGGILRANGGHLELGSVGRSSSSENTVTIAPTPTGWQFNYDAVRSFGTIQLDQKAMVASSGTGGGSIQVEAQKLLVQGRSALVLQNTGALPVGNFRIHTRESVEIIGTPGSGITNTLLSDVLGTGEGGNITVTTPRFLMAQGGGNFSARSFGVGKGGDITIVATSVELIGQTGSGVISTRVGGSGKGGDITIDTERFQSQNGGGIFATVNGGSGQGGNVLINATESIEMTRPNPRSDRNSIGSSAVTGTGNAGSITLNTPRLAVLDGTIVSTSTFGFGNAGKLTVNADSVEVAGFFSNSTSPEPGAIRAAAIQLDPVARRLFGLPNSPTGTSGSITINAKYVDITDRGQITVRNDGTNRGGELIINADSVSLKQGGGLTASTRSGTGGDIEVRLNNTLLMRYGGFISATAGGQGDGGNITISAPIILGLENSDIIANATGGRGGNVSITTQGIIGLEFRNTTTPRIDLTNDITASSESNINGSVQINNVDVDPTSGLVELSESLIDSSQKIAEGCAENQGSSFIISGRGGMPQNPINEARNDLHPWADLRDLSAYRTPRTVTAQLPTLPETIVQATDWQRNPQTGKVALIAAQAVPSDTAVTCAIAP